MRDNGKVEAGSAGRRRVVERRLAVVESMDRTKQEVVLATDKELENLQRQFSGVTIRWAENEDLAHWTLSDEMFRDDVPWAGVRLDAMEIQAVMGRRDVRR